MIQLTPQHRIYVCIQAIDFRKGIDALVGWCRGELQQDAFSGQVFVFRNRQGTAVKLLVYDGTGFWRASSEGWHIQQEINLPGEKSDPVA